MRTLPASAPASSLRVRASAAGPATNAVRQVKLGKSPVLVSEVGIGAWSWGDRSNYWRGWCKDDCQRAFDASMDAGLTFVDTAEVYGFGQSERFLGEFVKAKSGAAPPQIATKYASLPWRQTASSVVSALDASLERLDKTSIELYIQHWPGFFLNAFSNRATLEGLQMCLDAKKTEAVGVSNFNASRVREASKFFEGNGACLSSNQVQYSLLYREPERNGVLDACKEHGVSLVAYSPLCQGMLTGKYSAGNVPSGPRKMYFADSRFAEVASLLSLMDAIAEETGKSKAQIAINWLLCKDVIPIPGVRNASQVADIVRACGWRLTDGQVAELDRVSDKIPSSTGAPFEKW